MVGGVGGSVGVLLLVGTVVACAMILLRRKRAERFPFRPKAAALERRRGVVFLEVGSPPKSKSRKSRRIAPHPPVSARPDNRRVEVATRPPVSAPAPDKGGATAEGALEAAERWTKGVKDVQSLQQFTMRQERIGRELEKHDIGKAQCLGHWHASSPRSHFSQRRLDLAEAPIKRSRPKGSMEQGELRESDFGKRGQHDASSAAGKQACVTVDLPYTTRLLPGDTNLAAELLLDEAVRQEVARSWEQPRQLVEASRNLVWWRSRIEAGRSSRRSSAAVGEEPPTNVEQEVAVSTRSEIRDAVAARMSERMLAETVTETVTETTPAPVAQSAVQATVHCGRAARRDPGDNGSLELAGSSPPRRSASRLLAGKGILHRRLRWRVQPSAAYKI